MRRGIQMVAVALLAFVAACDAAPTAPVDTELPELVAREWVDGVCNLQGTGTIVATFGGDIGISIGADCGYHTFTGTIQASTYSGGFNGYHSTNGPQTVLYDGGNFGIGGGPSVQELCANHQGPLSVSGTISISEVFGSGGSGLADAFGTIQCGGPGGGMLNRVYKFNGLQRWGLRSP